MRGGPYRGLVLRRVAINGFSVAGKGEGGGGGGGGGAVVSAVAGRFLTSVDDFVCLFLCCF